MSKKTKVFIFSLLVGAVLGTKSQAAAPAGFGSFWSEFKTAIEKNDKESVASMVQYPLENTLPNIASKNKEEFLAKYPALFSDSARQAILKAKPESVEGEGISSIHYCVKAKECYLMSFKKVDQKYKLIHVGPFGE